MPEPQPRIKIRFEGDPADGGNVRLPDFVVKVQALLDSLFVAEQLLPDDERARVFYRITKMETQSPSELTVEVHSSRKATRGAVVRAWSNILRGVSDAKPRVPENASPDQIAPFVAMVPTTDTHLAKVVAIPLGIRQRKQIELRQQKPDWMPAIARIHSQEPEYSFGSIAGQLDAVNLHAGANKFYLYPRFGPRVACHFSDRMKGRVKSAIEKYVRVYGRLKFYAGNNNATEIDQVSDIDVHEAPASLPTFGDLSGIAPNATGGMNIRDYVESMYDDV